MSAIQAISAMQSTIAANNAAYNMMRISDARMGLLSNPGLMSYSMDELCAMDTQYELDMISNSLQYKMAKAMAESMKKLQKEEAQKFSVFA